MRALLSYALLALSTALFPVSHAQDGGDPPYTFVNNCPSTIEIFDGTDSIATLATGASTTRSDLGGIRFFYTSANGGRGSNGYAIGPRAAFFFEPQFWYYYTWRHRNPNNINVGFKVEPDQPATSDGFCAASTCTDGTNCPGWYESGRFRFPPPPDSPAPVPPLYQCRVPDAAFTITFCPSGSFPAAPGTPIRSHISGTKCLDVRGAVFTNGTAVQIYDCNGTNAQNWLIKQGVGPIRVKGTNFCLDSGTSPTNGSKMKIWKCIDNLPAQTWNVTDHFAGEDMIQRVGTGLCLDLTKGSTTNANVAQVWGCNRNFSSPQWPNQIWHAYP